MPHVDTGGITAGGRGSLSPFWAGLFGIPQKPNKRQQDGKRQQATAGTSTRSTGEAVGGFVQPEGRSICRFAVYRLLTPFPAFLTFHHIPT